MNEIRNGNIRIKRHMSHKHNQMKNVNLMKSSHFLSSEDELTLSRNKRSDESHAEVITTTTAYNKSNESTTICITKPPTHISTSVESHHGKKRDASHSETTTTSVTHISDHDSACVQIPTADTEFINFQIGIAVLLSFLFILAYFILNFCSRDVCSKITNKIMTGPRKYVTQSFKLIN